jgi:NTP pyrophosphatase (non-canonical NTP hydrolase)
MSYELVKKEVETTRARFQQWYGASKYTQLGNPGQYLQPCYDSWLACTLQPSFQEQVFPWTRKVFGTEVATHKPTRLFRFIEEAVELVQAGGATRDQVMAVVDYVFNRPVGEVKQEVGGVMVTLAALCNAFDVNMNAEGTAELERVQSEEMIEKIRKKQQSKLFNIYDVAAGVPTYVDPSKLMSKSERQVRRILARYAAGPGAYFDDGEASDSGEYPVIDFLRFPPDQIEKCLAERNLKKNQPLLDAVRKKNEVLEDDVEELYNISHGFTKEITGLYIPEQPCSNRGLKMIVISSQYLKKRQMWDAISESLEKVDVKTIDVLTAVALARNTYAFRMHVASWHVYIRRCKEEFVNRREGDESVWRGLYENEVRTKP